jgi:hypothetical protein
VAASHRGITLAGVTIWARAPYATAGGAAVPGDPAVRRATRLVAVVLCLLAVAEAGYGASNGGAGEALMVVAMFVLPLLYVLPATRPLWLRHRYPLLAVQAVLTCLPFALFGQRAVPGPPGWLAGLVLLTVPWPVSWLVSAALAAADLALRVGVVGLPFAGTPAAAALGVWAVIAFVLDALILFGLAGSPTSSPRCTRPGTNSPRRRSPPSGSGRPTACGPRSVTALPRRPGAQPPPCRRSPGASRRPASTWREPPRPPVRRSMTCAR